MIKVEVHCVSSRTRLAAYTGLTQDAVLELYAIEIQMYSDLKESKKLKVRLTSSRGREKKPPAYSA